MPHVYILKTENGYYTGSTANLSKRLKQHQAGEIKYTKSRLPVELAYAEEFPTRGEAQAKEYKIKSWKSSRLIESLIRKAQNHRGPIV